MNKRRANVIISITALIAVCAVVLGVCFNAVTADHDCCGDDCLICEIIQLYKENSKSILLCGTCFIFVFKYLFDRLNALKQTYFKVAYTPIVMHVKLSD